MSDLTSPPTPPQLDPNDRLTVLVTRLKTVLLDLPSSFEFTNQISGVNATDLFSLNSLLGASIEGQVVKALNKQRALWDPDDEWLGYTFERQSQAFPDVRLTRRSADQGPEVALGIELKGWFLISKEGEPSFRFTTTPAACAPHDLLVVVPWYLDNVLSGSPLAAQPYIVSARWAAEYRNFYWQHLRKAAPGTDRGITSPVAHPYPSKNDLIADVPSYDGGGNFGRVARVPGLMTDWIAETNRLEVLGIRIEDWFRFLRAHSDQADPDEVTATLATQLRRILRPRSDAQADRVLAALQLLIDAYQARPVD